MFSEYAGPCVAHAAKVVGPTDATKETCSGDTYTAPASSIADASHKSYYFPHLMDCAAAALPSPIQISRFVRSASVQLEAMSVARASRRGRMTNSEFMDEATEWRLSYLTQNKENKNVSCISLLSVDIFSTHD